MCSNLRLAEILSACELFEPARYHLAEAERLVGRIYAMGAAHVQVQLGIAAYHAAMDEMDLAEQVALKVLDSVDASIFSRGQLLCPGFLLGLYLRQRRVLRLWVIGWRTVDTWRGGGELRRNSLPRLILRLPSIVGLFLRRGDGRTP